MPELVRNFALGLKPEKIVGKHKVVLGLVGETAKLGSTDSEFSLD